MTFRMFVLLLLAGAILADVALLALLGWYARRRGRTRTPKPWRDL